METYNTRPLISVLIPSFNHAQYIISCLTSILEDEYPNKEIIVIDDGSTDNSIDIIKHWYETKKDEISFPFKLLSRENRGVTKTLNELVSYASGIYLCFIASDDYLLANGINERVAYLEANPSKKAVFGDCVVVDKNGEIFLESGIQQLYNGRKEYLSNNNLMAYELIFRWCVPGPVLMVKRDVFDLIGGFDERLAIEDWDFYLKLCAKGLLGFTDIPVAAYRVHDRNTCINKPLNPKLQESVYHCLNNNYFRFEGLKKWSLYAQKENAQAAKYRREGNLLGWFFHRAIGFSLCKITNGMYKMKMLCNSIYSF